MSVILAGRKMRSYKGKPTRKEMERCYAEIFHFGTRRKLIILPDTLLRLDNLHYDGKPLRTLSL